jgi:hypothetical protein
MRSKFKSESAIEITLRFCADHVLAIGDNFVG